LIELGLKITGLVKDNLEGEYAQKLAGMKALVTGAGIGIGREIALEFARQGADVALHYASSDVGGKVGS